MAVGRYAGPLPRRTPPVCGLTAVKKTAVRVYGFHGDASTTPQITRETPNLPWSAASIAGETVQGKPSRLVSFPLSYRRDKTIEDGPTQGGGLNAVGVWLGTGYL